MVKQTKVTTKSKTDIKSLIEQSRNKFSEVAPTWLSIDRLIRLALAARSRDPKLAQCTIDSFLLFCMQCAETGLEPIGAGGAWPVPFYNTSIQGFECQFIPDWRGLIHLAKKSEQIKSAKARIVHENDEFEYEEGDNPHIYHKPAIENPGETIGFYCIVTLPDGEKEHTWMRIDEINDIMHRSKSKNKKGEIIGPWKTDYDQMAIKTVTKRALKPFYGASPEMVKAIGYDNQVIGLLEPIEEPQPIEEISQELPPEKQEENISQEIPEQKQTEKQKEKFSQDPATQPTDDQGRLL